MGVGNLYYLNYLTEHQQANAAHNQSQQSDIDVMVILEYKNLQKLAKEELVLTSESHDWRESNTRGP